MSDVIEAPAPNSDAETLAPAKKSKLSVEQVDLFYGAAQALRRVSLTVESGEITCLLGRNGVGKTSLLRAIMGIHAISSGAIIWEDEPLGKLAPYERAARGIAYVPQGREIFPLLTVRENLETGFATANGEKTIPDYVFELFPVLKSMLRRRGGDLSGGQQQQLAIGRALVSRPRLLVLDEPTEGIQPSIIKDIGRAITFLKDKVGLAILLVEQYLDFARELADSIAIMDRGQIVVAGAPSELDEKNVRRYLTV
jgi:urea transport system ATP-binding protein